MSLQPTASHLSPAGFSRGRSGDIDRHARFVAEIEQCYRQLGHGPFEASHRLIRLDAVTAFEESTCPEIIERGWLKPECLTLAVPIEASGEAWFCGQPLEPGRVALIGGPREFMFRTPHRLRLGVLLLQEEFASLTWGRAVLPARGSGRTVARSPAELQQISGHFASIMRLGRQLAGRGSSDDPWRARIERELIDDLQRLVLD